MKTASSTLTGVLIFLFSGVTVFSQDVNEKVKDIKDPVNKITISAGGQDYIFEGEDAEKLFNKLKRSSSNSFVMSVDDDEGGKEKIIIINPDDDFDEDAFEFESDFDEDGEGIQKKIKVEMEDGQKKVTVTTRENGEEKVEVYEGDEAQEFLDKYKSENDDFFEFEIHDGKDKKVKKIKIEKKEVDSES
jgi:hypothetical protein